MDHKPILLKKVPVGIRRKDMELLRQDSDSILQKLRLIRQFPDTVRVEKQVEEETAPGALAVDCLC